MSPDSQRSWTGGSRHCIRSSTPVSSRDATWTSHVAELSEHGIDGIDVVVGNLYPFVETVRKTDVTLEDALENIDIGGPTMIRAAAKNFPSVIVIVDSADYGWVGERIRALTNGGTIRRRA